MYPAADPQVRRPQKPSCTEHAPDEWAAGVLGASAESLGRARGNPKENLGASMGTDKGPIGLAQSSLQQARTLAICNLAASGVQCPPTWTIELFFFLCLIIVVGIRRLGGRQTDNKETKSNDSEKEGSTCPSIGNPFFSLFESPGDHGVMVKKGVQFQLFQGAVQAAQNPLLHSPIGSRFTIPVCVCVAVLFTATRDRSALLPRRFVVKIASH